MNRMIPLYHIYIEFVKSVDKAQSPLYFTELHWFDLSHFRYQLVQLFAIQNMTNTYIIWFLMSYMINMLWIARYWQKSL